MNSVLSICEEYSDNVWSSSCGNLKFPEKIALDIEKKYKIPLIKSLFAHGYILESERVSENTLVLTFIKKNKNEEL